MPIFIRDGWKRIPFLINSFCYNVPSNKLLEELIGEADIESQTLFQKHSNELVESIRREGNFLLPHKEIEEKLCVCLGDSWNAFQRHAAIVDYCKGVLPQTVSGPQKGIDAAHATLSVFNQALGRRRIDYIPSAFPVKRNSDGIPIENSRTLELCSRSAEFKNSSDYMLSFYERVIGQASNPIIDKLVLEYCEALQRIALDNRRLAPTTGQELLRECPYCGKFFEMLRGRSGKLKPHCGAVQCQRHYDRLKPSKQKRLKPPTGWVAAQPQQRRCRLCRKNSQPVDLNRLCKDCFSEPSL